MVGPYAVGSVAMRPKSGTASRLRLATFLVCVLLTAACGSATYIPWNGRGGPAPAAPAVAAVSSVTGDKSNEVGRELGPFQRRRHRPIFRNDAVRSTYSSDRFKVA